MNDIKEFILSRKDIKRKYLAEKIQWCSTSFSHWLRGKRGIPKEKKELLREVLKQYGFNK